MPSNAPLPPVNLPPLPPLKNSTAKPGLPRRPLAAKGLPGSGSSAATSTPAAKKARPAAPVVAAAVAPPVAAVPVPLPPPVVASAPVTGKRERGSNTSRNAAAQHASSSVADEREDGEVADQETATEATEWLKRESKRAEADKTFAEIVGTASPKRARHSPRPGDNSKPVRAAKAAAAIAVTKSSTSRTASNTTTTATSTASTAAVTATSVTPVESAPPPPVATRSAASSRTRSAGNDTTATTAATATTAKTSSTLTAKQQRDNMQSQAKKLKHLGDAMLKDAADLQDRKEAYQSLLSAGLLWLEVVSLSDEPRPLLKQTADYFSYHVGNLDALPRYASCFLRCRAVTLAQLARCQDTENSKQMCAQAKKQLDGARREVKAHSSEIGATLRKLVAADGAAEQVVRLCDAVNDAREKWARAVQLWQAEGGTPLAWPGDGDFLAMSLQDFVDFVRKNLAQLLGE